jgi:hypothetical protein
LFVCVCVYVCTCVCVRDVSFILRTVRHLQDAGVCVCVCVCVRVCECVRA